MFAASLYYAAQRIAFYSSFTQMYKERFDVKNCSENF